MNIKEEIIKLSKDIGISKIGFTTADDFDYLEKSLRLAVEEGRNSGFEHKNIEERIKPKLSLASAKTIISIAVAIPQAQATATKDSLQTGEIHSQQLGTGLPLCPTGQARSACKGN